MQIAPQLLFHSLPVSSLRASYPFQNPQVKSILSNLRASTMSKNTIAPRFTEWITQTFGLPEETQTDDADTNTRSCPIEQLDALAALGINTETSATQQKKVTEAEAVQSFIAWFKALLETWEDDVRYEGKKQRPLTGASDALYTDIIHQLAAMKEDFGSEANKSSKGPPMVWISNLLQRTLEAAERSDINVYAQKWRMYIVSALRDWEVNARHFADLTKAGEPYTEGIAKGMKEYKERDDMTNSHLKPGEKPYIGFVGNKTHKELLAGLFEETQERK